MNKPLPRRPGRPRSERARKAALNAALALAAEREPSTLTMDAIAKRAEVSKDTLYRWWHSKTEVVLDALAERGQATIPLPDTGTLEGDLRAFLRSTADSANEGTRRLLREMAAAAAADPTVADAVRDRFILTRRAALTDLLRRAVERGELAEESVGLLLDLVYGSLWYRLIFNLGALDYEWADQIAALMEARGR